MTKQEQALKDAQERALQGQSLFAMMVQNQFDELRDYFKNPGLSDEMCEAHAIDEIGTILDFISEKTSGLLYEHREKKTGKGRQ